MPSSRVLRTTIVLLGPMLAIPIPLQGRRPALPEQSRACGMRDAGYQFVVIDDCWQVSRDSQGNIIADPDRFPSGMKALAADVHARGLPSSASTRTRAHGRARGVLAAAGTKSRMPGSTPHGVSTT